MLPQFADHFAVYAMARRGRAPSGDAAEYSSSVEADDIVHVLEAIGRPMTFVAHSYGALAAMEVHDRWRDVERVILYEPPVAFAPLGPTAEERVGGDGAICKSRQPG